MYLELRRYRLSRTDKANFDDLGVARNAARISGCHKQAAMGNAARASDAPTRYLCWRGDGKHLQATRASHDVARVVAGSMGSHLVMKTPNVELTGAARHERETKP